MSEMVYYRNLEEQLLVFPVLGNPVGIELKFVKSIDLVSELIPIPRSPIYILGIVNIDSNIYPVIDLDILLSGKNTTESKQTIVSLIDIKDTIFGVHTHELPSVIPGTANKVDDKLNSIPKEWILGYTDHDKFGQIPILDPKTFWVGMGENQVTGPSLNKDLTSDEIIQETPKSDDQADNRDPNVEPVSSITREIENISIEDEILSDLATTSNIKPEEPSDDQISEEMSLKDTINSDLKKLKGIKDNIIADLEAAGFNSIKSIIEASKSELMMIDGIGEKTAQSILDAANVVQDDNTSVEAEENLE